MENVVLLTMYLDFADKMYDKYGCYSYYHKGVVFMGKECQD